MTIHHLFGREDTYVITTDHKRNDNEKRRGPHGGAHLYSPKVNASVEWSIWPKHGFGAGLILGRNGSESDLGLDVHAFRLGSLWLRFRSPWTAWARIAQGKDHWWEARHYGVQVASGSHSWLRLQLGTFNGMGREHRHRDLNVNKHTFLGRVRTETVEGVRGETVVPMPEGDYPATWVEVTSTSRYVAPLGRLLDRTRGPKVYRYVRLDIPGGIPVEGKGENSWDCGMDGTMGASGATVNEAVRNAIDSTLRSRKRYGGPTNLPHPMTISEAQAHVYGEEVS